MPTPIHTESEDDKNYRNFQNEVAKLQKVNEQPNPNVVKIMSWGLTDSGSFPFIEMEYIEGPDLCELLQPPHDRIFTLKEAIRVADQLSGALAHCHNVGVKHGDVKSNNVKYNIHTGNYVLLDFGLAIMTEEQRRTSIRHAGAIEFMAPEQHEGRMLPQTDVYSFGIILYELLTGEVPFPLQGNGETGRNTVMLAHMESPVPDLLANRKIALPATWSDQKKAQEMQVPKWLLQIIDKCLHKYPESRYKSGIELHDAIINGSLASETSIAVQQPQAQQSGLNAIALQSENERLQAQLLQYQQAETAGTEVNNEDDGSEVKLSKPLFYVFITLLILFMGFSVYSAFFSHPQQYSAAQRDSSATQQPDTGTMKANSDMPQTVTAPDPVAEKQRITDSVKASIQKSLEAERQKARRDSLNNLVPDTSIKPQAVEIPGN